MISPTEELSKFACELTFERLPKDSLHAAKRVIMNDLMCILGGATTKKGKKLAEIIKSFESKEESTLIGIGDKASCMHAAFFGSNSLSIMNSMCGYSPTGGIHPGEMLVAATFAVAEPYRLNGKDLITAIVAGTEVISRIGLALQPDAPYVWNKGISCCGTAGCIGSSVAVGKLLGLDWRGIERAIGLAVQFAPLGMYGIQPAGFPSDVRLGGQILSPGASASAGVQAALYAHKGFGGISHVLESPKGFCYGLSENPDLNELTKGLGEKYKIEDFYFKRYGACRFVNGAIDVALELTKKHDIKPDDVERIIVKASTMTAKRNKYVAMSDSLFDKQSKSLQYNVAYAITHRDAISDPRYSLDETMHRDERVYELEKRVEVLHEPEYDKAWPAMPTYVEIFMKNGEKYSNLVKSFSGEPTNSPLTDEELEERIRKVTSVILSKERVSNVVDCIWQLEKIGDVSELIDLLSPK